MAQAILQVKHWGNSLGVRLPSAIAKLLHLHANQQVKLTVEADRLIIAPIKESLSDKLTRFDAERHGGGKAPYGAVPGMGRSLYVAGTLRF
jgi:antitoxin MazE